MKPKLCIFGADPNTRNLGVSALCHAAVAGILAREPGAQLTVFDYGKSMREGGAIIDGREVRYRLCGGNHSRRWYRRDCLWNMRVSGWLGGLGNPALRILADADAALDVSGGDSFTDLHGMHRFGMIALPKLIALEQGVPLILLPQTYGPYLAPRVRRICERIVRGARMAWARDAWSFESLKELLGPAFDPERHRMGVDLAFGLEARAPRNAPDLVGQAAGRPVVGFNVSGLVYFGAQAFARDYGLVADYRAAVLGFLRRLLSESDARVVLVPHVLAEHGHYESDPEACRLVHEELQAAAGGRVTLLEPAFDQNEMKAIISGFDWFCGTRMHSTIAGLSSGVPTAAIAYSPKFQGVFASCDQRERIADARTLDTEGIVDFLWTCWRERAAARETLRAALPRVLSQADEQMDAILSALVPVTPVTA